jgi:hypothetical protein
VLDSAEEVVPVLRVEREHDTRGILTIPHNDHSRPDGRRLDTISAAYAAVAALDPLHVAQVHLSMAFLIRSSDARWGKSMEPTASSFSVERGIHLHDRHPSLMLPDLVSGIDLVGKFDAELFLLLGAERSG